MLFFFSTKHVVMCCIKQFCDIFSVTVYFLKFETCYSFIVNLLQYSSNTMVYTLKLNMKIHLYQTWYKLYDERNFMFQGLHISLMFHMELPQFGCVP